MAKDYFAEEIETSPVSSGKDYFSEEIGNTPNSAFLPGQNRVRTLLAQRQLEKQSIAENAPKNMLDAIIHPSKLPLTGLSAGMEGLSRVESTIANPALDLQEGNVRPVSMPTNPGEVVNNASQVVSDLVPSIIQGITGQKKGQLGDIMRNVGAPEPVASSIGLLGMLGLGNLATKGNIAPSVVGKSLPEIAGNVKNEVSGIGNAVKSGINNTGETIKDLSNKFWRSGLPKEEVVRLDKEYGLSNSSLVDTVKTKLNNKIGVADEAYRVAMDNAPEGKQINIRPAIEQAGKKLKKLGLITEKGTLTELGNSEIARDSVYGKLLDFYKSADSISGVGNLASKEALTEGQMLKYMKAQRQTLVNKDQFTFLRDKLNTLYKNKPSDVDVSSVVNQFYTDGENSGIKGLQQARQLTREAFQNESKFLNRNTGDLKIATEQKLSRIGTDKPLSKQELDHIRELERYIGHPIEKDAISINKVNKALERIKNLKKYGIGAGIGILGVKGVDKAHRVVTGSF